MLVFAGINAAVFTKIALSFTVLRTSREKISTLKPDGGSTNDLLQDELIFPFS